MYCTWYVSKIILINLDFELNWIEPSWKLVSQNRIESWNLCQNPALQKNDLFKHMLFFIFFCGLLFTVCKFWWLKTLNSTPLFIKGKSLVLYMLILQKVWNELRKFHSYGLGFEQSHNPKYEQYSYLIHALVNSSNKWILKSFALILLFSL